MNLWYYVISVLDIVMQHRHSRIIYKMILILKTFHTSSTLINIYPNVMCLRIACHLYSLLFVWNFLKNDTSCKWLFLTKINILNQTDFISDKTKVSTMFVHL